MTLEPKVLVLESKGSETLGLQVKQRIVVEPETGSTLIDDEFINRGTVPRKVAPWQNMRVRPNGLTFYPANQPSYRFAENTLTLKPKNGVCWFLHAPTPIKNDSMKSYADGEEGWLAHVDGRLLFIKQFENGKATEQAPIEGEVVLYVHNSGRFVEMEQQGSFQEIAPGASRHYRVRWFLRELPEQIATERDNPALVNYAREQLLHSKL